MKLYFQPPTSKWCIESGFLKRWEERMEAVPTATEHYTIVSQPSAADICIVPWGEYITYELAQVLRPITRKDVETIVWEFCDWPTGRESGFYCSLRRRLFDPTRHCSISYPVRFNEFVAHAPLDEATLDFGFVGQMSAGVRVRLMERFGPVASSLNATMIDASGVVPWQMFGHAPEGGKRLYADFIRKTKFILCPRGLGTSSIRLFEALMSGRVPIIISNNYVLPTLQGSTTWQDAALFVRESRIETIPTVVGENLPRWETMANSARRLWEENFSDETVIDLIASNLKRIAATQVRDRLPRLRYNFRLATAIAEERVRPALGSIKKVVAARFGADH
jgi:hypothetical protein